MLQTASKLLHHRRFELVRVAAEQADHDHHMAVGVQHRHAQRRAYLQGSGTLVPGLVARVLRIGRRGLDAQAAPGARRQPLAARRIGVQHGFRARRLQQAGDLFGTRPGAVFNGKHAVRPQPHQQRRGKPRQLSQRLDAFGAHIGPQRAARRQVRSQHVQVGGHDLGLHVELVLEVFFDAGLGRAQRAVAVARRQQGMVQAAAEQLAVQALGLGQPGAADADQRVHLADLARARRDRFTAGVRVQQKAQVLQLALLQPLQLLRQQGAQNGRGCLFLVQSGVKAFDELVGQLAQMGLGLGHQLDRHRPKGVGVDLDLGLRRVAGMQPPPAGAVVLVQLGLVHRGVGHADQRVGVLRVGREQRHAHGHAEHGLGVGVDRERRFHGFVQAFEQARELGLHARLDQILDHDDEFVTAQAHQLVGLAQAGQQPARELAQQTVTGFVAMVVIDGLEIVKIQHAHGDDVAAAVRPRQRLGQVVVQRAPVRQAGQHVVQRFEFDAHLQLVARGHVHHRPHGQLPFGLLHHAARQVAAYDLAAGALQAHAAKLAGTLGAQRRVERAHAAEGLVVRVQAAGELAHQTLLVRVADHAGEMVIGVDDVAPARHHNADQRVAQQAFAHLAALALARNQIKPVQTPRHVAREFFHHRAQLAVEHIRLLVVDRQHRPDGAATVQRQGRARTQSEGARAQMPGRQEVLRFIGIDEKGPALAPGTPDAALALGQRRVGGQQQPVQRLGAPGGRDEFKATLGIGSGDVGQCQMRMARRQIAQRLQQRVLRHVAANRLIDQGQQAVEILEPAQIALHVTALVDFGLQLGVQVEQVKGLLAQPAVDLAQGIDQTVFDIRDIGIGRRRGAGLQRQDFAGHVGVDHHDVVQQPLGKKTQQLGGNGAMVGAGHRLRAAQEIAEIAVRRQMRLAVRGAHRPALHQLGLHAEMGACVVQQFFNQRLQRLALVALRLGLGQQVEQRQQLLVLLVDRLQTGA